MAETVEMYQYIRKNLQVPDPVTGLCQVPVIALAGQKIIVCVTTSGGLTSVSFSGVRLDASTGQELGKINVGSYPNPDVNISLYEVPSGTNVVGLITCSIPGALSSGPGVIDIAISVPVPVAAPLAWSSSASGLGLLTSYESDVPGISVARSIAMLPGQQLIGYSDLSIADIGFFFMGREFDSTGVETLVNGGTTGIDNSTANVLYTCPDDKTAIVDALIVSRLQLSSGRARLYLYGIPLTDDPDGLYIEGGGGGGEA